MHIDNISKYCVTTFLIMIIIWIKICFNCFLTFKMSHDDLIKIEKFARLCHALLSLRIYHHYVLDDFIWFMGDIVQCCIYDFESEACEFCERVDIWVEVWKREIIMFEGAAAYTHLHYCTRLLDATNTGCFVCLDCNSIT